MLAKLFQRLKGELAVALIRTFIARGIAAVGGVLLFVVLGRLYGAEGVGVFALAQSIYLGAGIMARYGMDNALMRYVGQDPESEAIRTYLRWAMMKSASLSIITVIPVYFFRYNFAEFFDAPMLAEALPGIALAIPPFTLAFVLGGFMKGIRRPATACLLENGSIFLVSGVLLLGLNALWPVGIANAGWATALAAWLVFGQGGWQTWRWFRGRNLSIEEQAVSYGVFKNSSNAFFVMSLAGFMQNVLSIMIAGWMLSSADLGLFKSAERTAFLIGFILLVLNAILPPRFASLYRQGDLNGLGALARKGALFGLALASPLLLICLFFPSWALGAFGPEFSDADLLLRILAIAQVINVATGSVGFLLSMTGHERLMRNISLACNTLGLFMFFALIPSFGAVGASLALAFVLVLQNLTALVFVWRKLGIWTLPMEHIFKRWRSSTHVKDVKG